MKPTAFEISAFLDSEEMIANYLNTVLEEGDRLLIIGDKEGLASLDKTYAVD